MRRKRYSGHASRAVGESLRREKLRYLLLQLGEKIEGIEGFELIEIGFAKFFEDGAVQGGEEDLLRAVGVGRGAGR